MLTEQMMVADALDALGAPYAIGGSFASALHGVMRATMDADLVADLRFRPLPVGPPPVAPVERAP